MSVERDTRAASTSAATVNADNPWPGLLAFRESDREYFQGRAGETEELFRIVLRERLVVLFGLSGLGKSSLLQAGLFPRLRPQRILPVSIRIDFSRGAGDLVTQVVACLARDAAAHRVEVPTARDGETLWEYFHRAGNHLWSDRNRPVMPLLVFDQFEEVFTLGRLSPERAAATEGFIEQLADIAEGRPPAALRSYLDQHPDDAAGFDFSRHHYKVLLSIREDFLPDLESLRARMPGVALNRFRLRRMNGEAALHVVSQAAHLIDTDVAGQVVRFVAADRGARSLADLEVEPALLSVVCRELNNRRLSLQQDRITTSLLEGSQEQVLTDFYERSTADLPVEIRLFIEERLLTVSGFRDSVALENALSLPGVTIRHIDQLVERRLLRREDRGGVQRLELTHDLLAGVVRASRDARRQRDDAERERLALARQQEEQQQALLKAQEEERLEQQRAQEFEKRERERRELKQYRMAVVVVLALLAMAIGGAGWAWRAQRAANRAATRALEAQAEAQRLQMAADDASARAETQARIAEDLRAKAEGQTELAEGARVEATEAARISSSRELSTAALLNLPSDPELSLLLGLAAAERSVTADTADLFHRALHDSRVMFRLPVSAGPRTDNAFARSDDGFKISVDSTGAHVLILSPGGRLTAWDLSGRSPRRVYELPVGDYEAAAFSPDRRTLATAGVGDGISLWNLDDRRMAGELVPEGVPLREFHSVSFSPSGRLLAVARCAGPHRNLCENGILDVWDLTSRTRVAELRSIPGIARAIAWSSESSLAVGGSRGLGSGGQVAVWSNFREKPEAQLLGDDETRRIMGLAFGVSRDRELLSAQIESSDVQLLYPAGQFPAARRPTGHSGELRALARSSDGALVATAGADRTTRVWDAGSIDGRPLLTLAGHTVPVEAVAISDDKKRLVTVGADAARVWNLAGNGELGAWSEPPGAMLRGLSGDGRFVTIGRSAELLVVDLMSGRTRTIPGHVDHAPLSRDGGRLARSSLNTVITIDDAKGQRVPAPNAADGFLFQLEFSGDGRRLLMITDGPPRVWDVPTAGYLKVPGEFGIGAARGAISDNGQLVAVQGESRDDLVVWDVSRNRLVKMMPGAESGARLAFSPDGRWLAANADEGKVLLWDSQTGRIARTIPGHPGKATAVAFSADSRLLASAGGDGAIRLWDVATGAERLRLPGPSTDATRLAFSPNGARLTAATDAGEALVYALTLDELLEVARSRATRALTADECRQFVHRDRCDAGSER